MTWLWLCALGLLAMVFFFGHGSIDPAGLVGMAAWTGRMTVWFGSWALALLAGPALLLGIFLAGPPDRKGGSVMGIALLGLAALALCGSAVVKLPFVVCLF
jgi:hypothetical protein